MKKNFPLNIDSNNLPYNFLGVNTFLVWFYSFDYKRITEIYTNLITLIDLNFCCFY